MLSGSALAHGRSLMPISLIDAATHALPNAPGGGGKVALLAYDGSFHTTQPGEPNAAAK